MKLKNFFRKLPLPAKLVLIGIVPILFIIFLSIQLYNEKSKQVKLIGDYIIKIRESGDIGNLMFALQTERWYSYDYALKKRNYDSVIIQRRVTNSAISKLKESKDLDLRDFPEYTFIKNLPAIRDALDTIPGYSANAIMQFYTTAIFRLNLLNSTAPSSNVYLKPVYQDLISQKLLFEMITYLGIIRTNIYNILYTRQYMVEILMGTIGTHDVYNTYETEFLLKASPFMLSRYKYIRENTDLKPVINYIDGVFKTFKFDSSYTAASWWITSSNGITQLRSLQKYLWQSVEKRMNNIYRKEIRLKNQSLLILITALILVIAFIAYTIKVISQVLKELRIAAQKISKGSIDIHLQNMPDDVIGKVAHSILQINENNKRLAYAAEAIGKGNFRVAVVARSDEDLLGNSIVQMKNDLLQYSLQKERIQNEALDLVHKKDEFMSIASHELKTPVTSLKAFSQLLRMDSVNNGDKKNGLMFEKMDAQINKLSLLINSLLDSSSVTEGELIYNNHNFEFDKLVKESVEEMQRITAETQIILLNNSPAKVFGDRERIGQVVSNLLTNAIKYGKGFDMKVNVETHGAKIICSVHDDGIGISKDQQLKIFERFYRVSGLNLHTYPGLGLGLYISKEIVQKHNGEIWVESEPGHGTTFYFTLPLPEEIISA